MKRSTTAFGSHGQVATSLLAVLGLFVIVLPLISSCAAGNSTAVDQLALPGTTISALPASELAERYGIQVTLVGITAAGGFVDVRLKVVDATKAAQWMQDAKGMPELVVEERGAVLRSPVDAATDVSEIKAGKLFAALYPNSGNAVRRGTQVMIAIGDARFGPYMTQQ